MNQYTNPMIQASIKQYQTVEEKALAKIVDNIVKGIETTEPTSQPRFLWSYYSNNNARLIESVRAEPLNIHEANSFRNNKESNGGAIYIGTLDVMTVGSKPIAGYELTF